MGLKTQDDNPENYNWDNLILNQMPLPLDEPWQFPSIKKKQKKKEVRSWYRWVNAQREDIWYWGLH